MWRIWGRPLSHPQPLVPSGVRPGPTTHCLRVREVRAWGPVTNPTARALTSWPCALWGRHEGSRGGRSLAWVWGVRGRALSHPRTLVRSGVRPGLTTHWLWMRGSRAWGPVTDPTARALASWLCALWGRHEGAPGGAPLAWVWGVRGRALYHPRPLVLSGVRPGPTTHWLWVRGVRAWGPVTNPTARALASWLCALWGRHEGARGGAPLAWVWGVRGRALSHPRPLVRSGVRPGPTTHWLWVRGVRAWGPVTNPTAHALTSWPCALWGRHEGARGGRPLAWVWGVRGRALSHPRTLVRSGVRPGLTTHWLWVRVVRAWGTVTNPTARALASWLCALWGRHEGAPGGAPLAWVWGVRGRALYRPRPLVLSGVRPGPATHWLWVRGVRAWGPVTNPTARALASWLCALWGRHEGARGGAPLAWVWGVRGRALYHPRQLVLSGVRPGPTTHWLWVRGVRAWGPVTDPTARAPASWLCALWGGMRVPGGGRLLPGCGSSGDGRSPTPDLSSVRASGRGPLPTGCGCGGCGRGDPSPTPQRALLRGGLEFWLVWSESTMLSCGDTPNKVAETWLLRI